jgi:hypothetical protein
MVKELRVLGFEKGFKSNGIPNFEFEFQQSKAMLQHVCNI